MLNTNIALVLLTNISIFFKLPKILRKKFVAGNFSQSLRFNKFATKNFARLKFFSFISTIGLIILVQYEYYMTINFRDISD